MSLKEFAEQWIDVDGIRTRYFETGEGEPIVFVHGGTIGDATGAANAEDWAPVFPAFAQDNKVLSIDRLGQGLTGLPHRDEDYTMAASVAHVIAFLEAKGRGPFHLVGHSRGGYVVCRVTLERPDLVHSCVIVDSATCSPGVERNEFVFACNPHAAGTRESCIYTYEGYSRRHEHITDDWIDLKLRLIAEDKNAIASRKMHQVGLHETTFLPGLRIDRETLFARLTRDGLLRPTLLIWGYNDPTAPVSMAHELYKLIAQRQPRTRLHIINEAGHFTYREQPEAFNRVLREHLDAVACGA